MTTPHDEDEDVHHADQSPKVENPLAEHSNPDNNNGDVSPKREPHSTEQLAEEQYHDSTNPDESPLRPTPLSDFPGKPLSDLEAQKEEPQTLEAPDKNDDEESRPERKGEGVSDIGHRVEEHDQSRLGAVQGNGAAAAEHTGKELINLFVRNVAKHVMEQQLVDLFSKYGKVDSAVVVRDPHSKECRGFGFVKMCTEEGAKEAIAVLQEFEFEGRNISVERAKRSAPHSRTPGAYMGIDRRIRDRYAGMKRHREHEVGRYPPYPPHYDMRGGGGYRGRPYVPNRARPDERPWDYRVPYDNQPFDDRDRLRRRYNTDGPRHPPPRDFEREQRYREREAPVPRESADDFI